MVFCSFFAFLALWSYICLDGFRKHLQRYFFHSDAARPRMLQKNNTFRRGEPGGMLPKSNADVAKKQRGCCETATWRVAKKQHGGDRRGREWGFGNREPGTGLSAECRVKNGHRDLTPRRQDAKRKGWPVLCVFAPLREHPGRELET